MSFDSLLLVIYVHRSFILPMFFTECLLFRICIWCTAPQCHLSYLISFLCVFPTSCSFFFMMHYSWWHNPHPSNYCVEKSLQIKFSSASYNSVLSTMNWGIICVCELIVHVLPIVMPQVEDDTTGWHIQSSVRMGVLAYLFKSRWITLAALYPCFFQNIFDVIYSFSCTSSDSVIWSYFIICSCSKLVVFHSHNCTSNNK